MDLQLRGGRREKKASLKKRVLEKFIVLMVMIYKNLIKYIKVSTHIFFYRRVCSKVPSFFLFILVVVGWRMLFLMTLQVV